MEYPTQKNSTSSILTFLMKPIWNSGVRPLHHYTLRRFSCHTSRSDGNWSYVCLGQGSQTRGPPWVFVRPASIIKYYELYLKLWSEVLFSTNSGLLRHFFTWPAESFFFKMRPSNRSEFETPGLGLFGLPSCLSWKEQYQHFQNIFFVYFIIRVMAMTCHSEGKLKNDWNLLQMHIRKT